MKNVNSVCYINKINSISPIEGADKIEQCSVNGWNSIIQKGKHNVGDLVLCLTTDAVIPNDWVDKWNIGEYLRKGNRVRTIKLKGIYSECILIPLCDIDSTGMVEGDDLMEEFKIFKYEPPVKYIQDSNGKKHKYHQNPNFPVYYKFPNQKNTPDMFKEGDLVSITRKLHGTNTRYGIVKKRKLTILDKIKKLCGNKLINYEFIYGSHNVEKGSDSFGFYSINVWSEIANKYDIKKKLWDLVKHIPLDKLGSGIVIYGEIYGPGIQGNHYSYNKKERELALFDVELNNEYLGINGFYSIVRTLDLPDVEELYEGPWYKEIQDSFVLGSFIKGTKIPHEGVVIKCVTGNRHRVSKVINPDYLIFGEKHNVEDGH